MSDSADLKRAGLKATLPRMRILDLFAESEQRHLSAEDVYRLLLEKDIEVGLATVYRVLSQLQEAGLLKHARFESGKAVFELDDGRHHDHLVCTECGWVQEFHDEAIEQGQRRVTRQHGLELGEHSLVLYGRCLKRDCEHRKHASWRPAKT